MTKKHTTPHRLAAGLFISCAVATAAGAQNLTIGLAGAVTSIDPHYYNATPNNQIAYHIFDPLIRRTADGRLLPALATEWHATDDTHWDIRLRDGVTWHDGKPLTAEDVAFSLTRLRNIPGAPGGFASLVNSLSSVEATGPLSVRITTARPAPTLPAALSAIMIVSRHAGQDARTEDYNSGRAAIGTGQYRLTRYVSGERVELVRSDTARPAARWQQVTFRQIPSIATRTATVLAGDIDLIEAPAITDLARLRSDNRVTLSSTLSDRVAYVMPMQQLGADAEPVTTHDGRRIDPSPLTNRDVRRALSMAINRRGIAERIMQGTVEPTGQLLPAGYFSALPDVPVPDYDPEGAKRLLAAAGYPDGFRLTVAAANDRVPYNVEVVQAIAQMWARIGVAVNVNGVPTSVYVTLASNQRVPAYFGSWGNPSLESSQMMMSLLVTHRPEASTGTYNWARYSRPEFDRLVIDATQTLDDTRREAILRDATRFVLDDLGLIPVYHFVNLWAARRGLRYEPRADGMTLAEGVQAGAR